MTSLIVCESCKCHVKPTEETCPFCETAVPEELRAGPPRHPVPAGTSRVQAVALRAAVLAGMTAVTSACGGSDDGSTSTTHGGGGATASGGTQSGTGGNVVSASGGNSAAGGAVAAGGTGASGGGSAAGGAKATGGAVGSGGMGTGGFIAMPYGSVWPDPAKPVRV